MVTFHRELQLEAGRVHYAMKSVKFSKSNSAFTRQKQLGGFPDQSRVTLRYVTQVSQTSTSGVPNSYVFRANSVFDPDFTSTGAQPANYDDWTAQYNRYRVYGCRIRWKPIATSTTFPNLLATCVLAARHTSTNITSLEDAASMPYSVMDYRGPYNAANFDTWMSMNLTTREFLGMSKIQMEGDDDVASLYSANPAHVWYFHCALQCSDLSTSVTFRSLVMLEYDVLFYDRVDTTLDLRVSRMLAMKQQRLKCLRLKEDGVQGELGYDAKQPDEDPDPEVVFVDNRTTRGINPGPISAAATDGKSRQYVATPRR